MNNPNSIYVIAEAGINHNGNLETAKKLVDVSYDAGAHAVKFQTFWNIESLKKYELTKKEWYELENYCCYKGIQFLSTPHTFEAIHFLEDMMPYYKIASSYLGLPNFLKEVDSKKKTILLSTGSLIHNSGIATNEEIKNALKYIKQSDVVLMHCISKYPCKNPMFELLGRLKEFNKTIGISDHSLQLKIPRACFVEKHIKLNSKCIDNNVSLTPKQFKQFVDNMRCF